MTLAEQLDRAVREVCPIVGVIIGDRNDHSTWTADFDVSASDAQKKAAAKAIAEFTPNEQEELS